ncbi:MAG: hypothetical protein VKJ02_14220 [Snowella sp.]|nr:hypothetical protein [Snowella sp.]
MSNQEEIERIIITVDDTHLPDIQSVANHLQQEGMSVENILAISGIITGAVPCSRKASLQKVPGVASLEDEGQVWAI